MNPTPGIPIFKTGLCLMMVLALWPNVSRAQVTWGASSTIAADSDVITNGTQLYAFDWGNNSVTVNGVGFVGTSSTGGGGADLNIAASNGNINNNATAFGSTSAAPFTNLSSAYQEILKGGDYASSGSATLTVTLNSLTTGHEYAVQLWVNDDRPGEATRTEAVSSSNSITLAYNAIQAGGGVGQYGIGVFTASSGSQAFTMLGAAATQLNALQVRDVTGTGYSPPPPVIPQALWVHFGTNGLLQYYADNAGNRLPDFSYAGYLGGGVALPVVPVKETISPVNGDNTANIQNAINTVSALTPDANGFRGAVLLNPGTYQIAGTLSMSASGVVLRGSGNNTNTGTVLLVTGLSRNVINVGGSGSWSKTGGSYPITDSYVPLGATQFHVNSGATTLSVGDTVVVQRPQTQSWIDAIGMNLLTNPWTPGTGLEFERQITAINGNQITVDAPLCNPIESVWTTGEVFQVTDSSRIQQVGIENLCGVGQLTDYPSNILNGCFITYQNLKNSWAHDILMSGWGNGISLNNGLKWCTVQDCQYVNPATGTSSAAPAAYTFGNSAALSLFQRCTSDGGYYHIMVTQAGTPGPDVFLNFACSGTHYNGGPHQRWAAGALHDNINMAADSEGGYTPYLAINNRGNDGSGQGWGAGFSVMYNCQVPQFQLEQPATTTNQYNWTIGGIGSVDNYSDQGIYDTLGTLVSPRSLYLEQLKERLGPAAIQNIGYQVFVVSAAPPTNTVVAGNAGVFTVNVAGTNFFTDSVILNVSGLPAGISVNWTTNLIAGSGSAVLTISSLPSLPPGDYPLVVTAVDGNLTNTATIHLSVAALAPPVLTSPVSYNLNVLSFSFSGPVSQSYRILASTNLLAPLTNWLVLTNGYFGSGTVNFSDNTTNSRSQFYRIASP